PEADPDDRSLARTILATTLETTLRLLHPIAPFITEEIWQVLPREEETIMRAPYPEADPSWEEHAEAEEARGRIIETIRARRILSENAALIANLARTSEFAILDAAPSDDGKWASSPVAGAEAWLEIGEAYDAESERARIEKELAALAKEMEGLEARLSNPQ